ncbi:MAG: glycine zipper 2TM domain-containing protein [Gammaproteobacteria bacterium]|nr:glycine zipper 2TM domain-containing protein [Gammaproteobacteria bacterium]
MKLTKMPIVIATCLAAALAGGCANTNPRSETSQSYPTSTQSSGYGVIKSIETTRSSGNEIGMGTVIGGVVGGVLGSQVGGGSGKTAATVVGAVGGAVVGHEIEKSNQTRDAYHIRVRFDSGNYQTVTQDSINDLQVGDRVRVENNRVSRSYGNDYGYRYDAHGNRY